MITVLLRIHSIKKCRPEPILTPLLPWHGNASRGARTTRDTTPTFRSDSVWSKSPQRHQAKRVEGIARGFPGVRRTNIFAGPYKQLNGEPQAVVIQVSGTRSWGLVFANRWHVDSIGRRVRLLRRKESDPRLGLGVKRAEGTRHCVNLRKKGFNWMRSIHFVLRT